MFALFGVWLVRFLKEPRIGLEKQELLLSASMIYKRGRARTFASLFKGKGESII